MHYSMREYSTPEDLEPTTSITFVGVRPSDYHTASTFFAICPAHSYSHIPPVTIHPGGRQHGGV